MIDYDGRAWFGILFRIRGSFGVDEIGVEIEDPFGDDPNDLPLDAIGAGIETAVAEITR